MLLIGEGGGAWRALAERKLGDVNALIDQAQATRRLLEDSLRCTCQSRKECSAGHPPAQ